MLTVALSLSSIVPRATVAALSVIWGSPVTLSSDTLSDSLSSTRPSSIVGTVMEIGRASGRVGVQVGVVAVSLKKIAGPPKLWLVVASVQLAALTGTGNVA